MARSLYASTNSQVEVDACTGIPTAADLRYLPLGLLDSDWQITHFGGDLAGDYGVFEVVVRHVKQNGTTIVERTPQHMERFDNDESLAVKARVLGAKMLRHACRSLTRNGGLPPAEDQQWHRNRMGKGETRRRQFANASAIRTPLMSAKSQVLQRAFQLFRAGATLMLLPYIAQKRRKLERQGRAPVTILYYHGVGNGAESWATFPLEMFDRQVAYCYWYSKLIATSDALDGLRGARVHDAAVVLTFDDGYLSCHTNLVPYLTVHRVPATFYICAGSAKDHLLFPHDTQRGYLNCRVMDLTQVAELRDLGFEIGSHGMYHEEMDKLNDADLRQTLADSRSILQSASGSAVRWLALPRGLYTESTITTARDYYEAVFSAHGGYNIPGRCGFHYQRFSNPVELHSLAAIINGMHRLRPFGPDDRNAHSVM